MKSLFSIFIMLLCIKANAQTKEEFYKKANDLYDAKDYVNAIKQANRALEKDTSNIDCLFLLGNAYLKNKQFEESFTVFTKIIELDPKNASALSQRGVLLESIQQFDYALADLNRALEIKTDDTMRMTLLVNRAAIKIDTRDFQGAYNDLISAYKIDSTQIGVLNNLATVCDEVGKGDETLKYLYKILDIDSTFIGAYGNIGFKYQEMGDYKKAISFFNKVVSFDPNEPLAYSNRSYNRYKLDDLDGALNDIEKSIRLYPANSYAYRIRALIYIAKNKMKDACKDLDEALRLGFTKMYGPEADELKLKYCSAIE